MSDSREMVYSACVAWFADWVAADPPHLVDSWDLSNWMENEMTQATEVFLTHAFHTPRARNDALLILRALFYEYYLFQQQLAIATLKPNLDAATRIPAMPQTSQKSAAWHAESRNMLSGHEFGGIVVGGPAERNTILAKKCAPEIVVTGAEAEAESQTVFLSGESGLSPFKWGWRYEPVARALFEAAVAKAPVNDTLGRVRHPTLPRLGASPDGLITAGPRAGRLVEIKCPISRQLDGSVPLRYYCQMQLQAEVCDVDAVDYIEVQFAACEQDSVTPNILTLGKQPYIGKVCVTADSEETMPSAYSYEYSPLFPNTAEGYAACLDWTPVKPVVLEKSVWYVKDWYTTTVLRNKRWWADVGYPGYVQFWKDADEARRDGRYKSVALFIDSESEGSDREEHDVEGVADGAANDAAQDEPESDVEGWKGVESDHTIQDSDSDSDTAASAQS